MKHTTGRRADWHLVRQGRGGVEAAHHLLVCHFHDWEDRTRARQPNCLFNRSLEGEGGGQRNYAWKEMGVEMLIHLRLKEGEKKALRAD